MRRGLGAWLSRRVGWAPDCFSRGAGLGGQVSMSYSSPSLLIGFTMKRSDPLARLRPAGRIGA